MDLKEKKCKNCKNMVIDNKFDVFEIGTGIGGGYTNELTTYCSLTGFECSSIDKCPLENLNNTLK